MTTAPLDERFLGPALDPDVWVDHYLPQWTTPDRSAARYDLGDGGLVLRIDADQPEWRPADAGMRVSNLQTGTFSGPRGSTVGTHRHREDGLEVVTPQRTRALWTPRSGRVEVTASASPDPACMLGIWLVGVESVSPEDSGEICLAELFGHALGPESSTVRTGIKAHHDPRLRTEVDDVRVALDATTAHAYAAEWGADGVRVLVDGVPVWRSDQVLDYPLQLMLDLFEFTDEDADRDASAYPKTAVVHRVTGTAS